MRIKRAARSRLWFRRLLMPVAAAALVAGGLVGCSDDSSVADGDLVGLFRLTPGSVDGGGLTGTYFRMVQPNGNAQDGPFLVNANSPADGGRATILEPGTAGGLRTNAYQTQPNPGFAENGDSLAGSITKPTKFFAVAFSVSTNPVDLQTKSPVAPPKVKLRNGKLTADVSSWAASWNRQDFNQGAPKPIAAGTPAPPGGAQAERVWDWVSGRWLETAPKASLSGPEATGTFDPDTKKFTLDWTSLIQGGPFNSFIGKWHLEGVFESSASAPQSTGAQ